MNTTSLSLLAMAASLIAGVETLTVRATAEEPPVSIGKPPAPSPVPQPTPVAPPPSAPAQTSAAALEKLAMPIALHPDPLIAIILPASAYPLEIVQAARFVRDTNNISKIDQQPWDDNVKAVAKFPQLIEKMDADLGWTVQLGQAFIDQPKELMDTIQALRAKAQKAGTLRSNPQQVVTVTNVVVMQTNVTQIVTVTNQVVQVQPSNPQVVDVPTYPPTVYYPPPAYVYDPVTPLVTFGMGMAMGAIIANNCDWHGGGVYWGGGDVDVDIDNDINIDRGDRPDRGERPNSGNRANSSTRATQQKWQPNQSRMRSSGVPSSAQTQAARGWGGSSRPAQQPAGAAGARPSGGASSRPSTQPSSPSQRSSASTRPSPSAGGTRSGGQSSSANRPQSSSAFNGVSSGGGARDFSSRGASSRSSGGSRGGGGGGGMRGGGGGGGRR